MDKCTGIIKRRKWNVIIFIRIQVCQTFCWCGRIFFPRRFCTQYGELCLWYIFCSNHFRSVRQVTKKKYTRQLKLQWYTSPTFYIKRYGVYVKLHQFLSTEGAMMTYQANVNTEEAIVVRPKQGPFPTPRHWLFGFGLDFVASFMAGYILHVVSIVKWGSGRCWSHSLAEV